MSELGISDCIREMGECRGALRTSDVFSKLGHVGMVRQILKEGKRKIAYAALKF